MCHSYHGQEDAKLWVHVYNVTISEYELIFAVLLTTQDNSNLLGGHGQHGQLNTVELVEAAPCAGLGQTLVNECFRLTLKVLVATIDAQWEGKGDVGSARYEQALLPPFPTIRVLCYSN